MRVEPNFTPTGKGPPVPTFRLVWRVRQSQTLTLTHSITDCLTSDIRWAPPEFRVSGLRNTSQPAKPRASLAHVAYLLRQKALIYA